MPEPSPPQSSARPPRWTGRLARAAAARAKDATRAALHAAARGATWLWARRPTGPRLAAIAFAGVVAGLGAHGILFQAGLASRLPSALDWAAAQALLERDGRAGDAVALQPAWAERARLVVPARTPVFALPRYAGEDLVGVRRVWLLSIPGAPGVSPDPGVDLGDRAARADGPLRLGRLEAFRYDLAAPALPLAFLPDRIATATVRLGDAACEPETATSFRCASPGAAVEPASFGPSADAARVAREVRDVGGALRPCLVATPAAAPAPPLAIAFADVPMGRQLRVHAAPAGAAPPGFAAERLAVQVDGEEIAAVDVTPTRGWGTVRIDTTGHGGRAREVTFVLSAPGPAGPICFDAVTLP